ncbi:hypothetical protein CVE34_15965 [Pseudomonas syringae pv. actinidiae]|nr:hypothetical protein D9N00_25605 [Pseudomonas syringae pv. actinidiae]AYL82838.1 hypothetical protein CN228_25675 [Pseudomonas syringae pv. actinidiae str. Shaanxi_M228]NAT63771.1 hypothetical protein [Pseudomonas syringae pv. actinidifoliorum]NAS62566.1 hypothetical protein [Pseudomonas syringae pv. actinidiae]NAS65967.1 hypothetical protein [Pseudomonas syringae pv. actinidiae]
MLAPEKNREHSIKLQLPAWDVVFMRRLQLIPRKEPIHSNIHPIIPLYKSHRVFILNPSIGISSVLL